MHASALLDALHSLEYLVDAYEHIFAGGTQQGHVTLEMHKQLARAVHMLTVINLESLHASVVAEITERVDIMRIAEKLLASKSFPVV